MITENRYFIVVKNRLPHIAKSIELLWGTVEFNKWFDKLMSDTRDGMREGFPIDVSDALLKLSIKHDEDFPKLKLQVTDIWSTNFRAY
jgi:hypothetical protein